MKKFSEYIANHSKLIVILSILLMIPAIFGFINTKINYDILVYLPDSVETIKGEDILTNEFGIGAYAFVMTDCKSMKKVLDLEEKIKNIDGVNQVISIADMIDVTIPDSMLPSEVLEKIIKNDETIIMVTFAGGTSDDEVIQAVNNLREVIDASLVSSMTSLVIDTMNLSNNELVLYVVIAVIFCLFILGISTDSYLIPFLLLGNIGVAILYNMGTNIFLGSISYITQAITAILQLGVTTDFSIFLYHKYEQAKESEKSVQAAMAQAIRETFKSVLGSSLTTFAGFLALCTMDLTLGTDIGLVMAKGVLCGLLCVLTLFPALLLIFDKAIIKTKHKVLLPEFKKIQKFVIKHYKLGICLFLVLFIPAFIGNSRYEVYYKLDKGLPQDLPFNAANRHLKETFNITSPEIILLDKNLKKEKLEKLVEEIDAIEGINAVVAPDLYLDKNMQEMLPRDLKDAVLNQDYQIMFVLSNYEVASDLLNDQIGLLNEIVKKYDSKGIVAGEGPLMKDLVTIADHDFKAVNYTSLLVIFVIMIIVLKQIGLPVLLIITIEFAIFVNMACAYYMHVELPFIASIVVGTIQLGATIDYAILMSTKYLEERVGSSKEKAITKTLSLTIPSIVTSAMCFFAATFGVAVYTKIDMIGSICSLLARGSIISMIVVILVLPALLMVFDKIIFKRKEEKIMRNKRKNLKALLGISVFLLPISVMAKTKTENIYTNLDFYGNVEKSVVGNHLYTNDSDILIDDTILDNILNLNGDETYKKEKEKISWQAMGKDIFYEGVTTKELPMSFKANYYLNGEEMNPKDMKGRKGLVKIEYNFYNNSYFKSKKMYQPISLLFMTMMDNEKNTLKSITYGKVLDTGNTSYIIGVASPGLYDNTGLKEFKDFDKIILEYETQSFSLNEIYIVASPKLFSDMDLSIFEKLDELNSSMRLLGTNMDLLENGAKNLTSGIKELKSGSKELENGLKEVSNSLKLIKKGSISLDNGVLQILESLKSAEKMLQNPEIDGSLAQVEMLIKQNKEVILMLENNMDVNKDMIALLTKNNEALLSLLGVLQNINKNVSNMIVSLEASLNKVHLGMQDLTNNLGLLDTGVSKLYKGATLLGDGIVRLEDGSISLKDGVYKMNNEGIKILEANFKKINLYGQKMKNIVTLAKDYKGFSTNMADETTFIYKISGVK